MVVDYVRNIRSYYSLDESLKEISSFDVKDVPDFHGFHRNEKHTVIFTVERGSITASTSWRENPDSREAIAAVKVRSGMFVLYLPGESYIIKYDTENTEASMRILEERI